MRRSEILIIRYRRTRVVETRQQAPASVVSAKTNSVSTDHSKVVAVSNRPSEFIKVSVTRRLFWLGLINRFLSR